jgi:hypothetical protein
MHAQEWNYLELADQIVAELNWCCDIGCNGIVDRTRILRDAAIAEETRIQGLCKSMGIPEPPYGFIWHFWLFRNKPTPPPYKQEIFRENEKSKSKKTKAFWWW